MSLTKHQWKKIDPTKFFKFDIPDDWETLEDFVDWYIDAGMPIMPPWNAGVIRSDDAVSISLFRKGKYQAEFYLEYPRMYIKEHSHPDMEVIVLELGGSGGMYPKGPLDLSIKWGTLSKKLMPGEKHGGEQGMGLGNGHCIIAFQKWYNVEEVSSAAIQWKGGLHGPYQAELIKKYRPHAHVEDGFADVSKKES